MYILIYLVGDIPFLKTEADLIAFFLPCGKVLSLKLAKRDDGKANLGYGFIELSNSNDCKKVVQYCKRENFMSDRLTAIPLSELMSGQDDEGATYLKNISQSDLQSVLSSLAQIASQNTLQAQLLLQQNPNMLQALLEAEFRQGMLTQAAPGMDILLNIQQ